MQKQSYDKKVNNKKLRKKDKSLKTKKHPYDKMTHFEFFSKYSAEQFLRLLPSKVAFYEDDKYGMLFLEKDMNGRFRIGLEKGGHSGEWYCGEISERENGCYISGDIFYDPDKNPDYNKDYKPEKKPLRKKILEICGIVLFLPLVLIILLIDAVLFPEFAGADIAGMFIKTTPSKQDKLVDFMTKEMRCQLLVADKGQGSKENGGN